ncbi:MAG: phosphohydrolase [Bacteroidales bacterium 45-6]|nr:MAG: phosphohydrolase [Bacteroidales bacterium 45-6]
MDPFEIIEQYYEKDSPSYNILVRHSSDVANKAVKIVTNHPELNIDKKFVWEAAILHDIGIFLTNAPEIECYGTFPYIAHGFLGHDLLLRHHLPKHALVCERHTGAGLSVEEITHLKLPLPLRDMRPASIEEQVICFADCFFSKSNLEVEKTPEKVLNGLSKFGKDGARQFEKWCELFL